jgi:hypothetical protein
VGFCSTIQGEWREEDERAGRQPEPPHKTVLLERGQKVVITYTKASLAMVDSLRM